MSRRGRSSSTLLTDNFWPTLSRKEVEETFEDEVELQVAVATFVELHQGPRVVSRDWTGEFLRWWGEVQARQGKEGSE